MCHGRAAPVFVAPFVREAGPAQIFPEIDVAARPFRSQYPHEEPANALNSANALRLVSSVTTFAHVVAASEPIIGPLPLVGSLAFILVGCGAEISPAPPTPALPTPVVAIGPTATTAGATAPEPPSTAAPPPTPPPADDIDRTALALDPCAGRKLALAELDDCHCPDLAAAEAEEPPGRLACRVPTEQDRLRLVVDTNTTKHGDPVAVTVRVVNDGGEPAVLRMAWGAGFPRSLSLLKAVDGGGRDVTRPQGTCRGAGGPADWLTYTKWAAYVIEPGGEAYLGTEWSPREITFRNPPPPPSPGRSTAPPPFVGTGDPCDHVPGAALPAGTYDLTLGFPVDGAYAWKEPEVTVTLP